MLNQRETQQGQKLWKLWFYPKFLVLWSDQIIHFWLKKKLRSLPTLISRPVRTRVRHREWLLLDSSDEKLDQTCPGLFALSSGLGPDVPRSSPAAA